MMMSTPFAFDIVESSMRIVVDGVDIRVKRESYRMLRHEEAE